MPEHDTEQATGSGVDVRAMIHAVWPHRLRVVLVTIAAMVLTLAIAFLLPRWYRATAVILPPEDSDMLSNLSFASRALSKFPAFGVLGDYFTPADIYKAVLGSRTAQEHVVDAFDLGNVYGKRSREQTLKELKHHYRVKLASDGTISVEVEDRDPHRAAAMAMAFLEALDRYNIEKRSTQARRSRIFLERRVTETDSLLRVSEQALQTYQQIHAAVAPTSMSSTDVQVAADVMARKLMLEVKLGVLRTYLRDDNEQVLQTRTELEQLKRQVTEIPALQTELARLIRDNRVMEQLFLLLTAELEQARIREAQDTPTVQILDPAIPPERHSRPRRLILTLAAGVLAFLGSVGYLVIRSPRPAG
jgi:tyrosine-protein kinase Etk/Wzc